MMPFDTCDCRTMMFERSNRRVFLDENKNINRKNCSLLTENCLRSQTLINPSSPPDARNGSNLFQLITFTSDVCASISANMQAFDGVARISQTRILRSTLHEVKTYWKVKKQIDTICFSLFERISLHSVHSVTIECLQWMMYDR